MTLEEAIHYAEEVATWLKDYKRLRELETQPCEQQPCTDAISRSEAIRVASGYCHYTNIPDELAKLPSVTPKHCEDAISRQAVDDAIYEYSRSCDVNYAQIMEYIDKLPSVSTEKTGRWILTDKEEEIYCHVAICSVCGKESINEGVDDYCSWCGAKMEVEE